MGRVASASISPVQQAGGYYFDEDPNVAVNPYTNKPIGDAGDYGGTVYGPGSGQQVSSTYRDYRRGRPTSLGPVGSARGTQRIGGMHSSGDAGRGGEGVASGIQPSTARREYREFMQERSRTIRPPSEQGPESPLEGGMGGYRGARGRGQGGSVAERRRALAQGGGPRTLQRHRMAGQLGGYKSVDPTAVAAARYDPYRETWYEWGSDIGGTDEAGNVWSVGDLGIQY